MEHGIRRLSIAELIDLDKRAVRLRLWKSSEAIQREIDRRFSGCQATGKAA
jgi:hypothetical protein